MTTQQTVQSTNNPVTFHRFQVVMADEQFDGSFQKSKTVGMAYLREGQSTYTLRLWTLLNEKFYVLQSRSDANKYLVLTRELNKNTKGKNKYFWNIVGNGIVDSSRGFIKFEFDLFSKPIYMNIFPETVAHSSQMSEPDAFDESA